MKLNETQMENIKKCNKIQMYTLKSMIKYKWNKNVKSPFKTHTLKNEQLIYISIIYNWDINIKIVQTAMFKTNLKWK